MTPHAPTNPKIPLIPALLLLTCLFTTSLAAGTLQISASPTTINTSPSVYTFTPTATAYQTIPANSVIYIDFPSDYSGILPSSPICTNSTSYVLSCSVVSSLRISITNYFSTALFDNNFPFLITNMKNPSHTGATGTFTVSIVNPSSTTLVDGTKTVSLTTGSATCTLSTASKVIGGTTSVTFAVTPANAIPAGGGMQITFPAWSLSTDSMILSSQTMTCSISTPSSGTFGTCSASGNVLTMLSMPSAVSAGTVLTVTFSYIRNPPVGTSYSVSLTTLDASSLSLDTCSMSLLASVANTITVDSSSFVTCITNSNTKVINKVESCDIIFTTTNPLQSGATIDITFPTAITLTSGYTVNSYSPYAITGLTVSSSVSYPDVMLTNAVTSYTAGSTQFDIRFITMKQPSSTKPVTFSVTTYYGGIAIDTISGVSYSAAAGSLSSITLSGNPSTAGSSSAFTVSFVPTDSVSTSSTIVIVFPSEFTVGTVTCAGSGTKMASVPTCSVSSSTLTISSYATSSITSSDTVGIIISSVTLPPTTKPTNTPFQISTYDGGYMVDTNTVTYFSSTVAAITAGLSVTVSSGAVVGGTSTYTISFQNKNPVPATGTFQIGLPSDNTISISSTTTVESSTQTNIGGTVSTVTATVSTISSIVTISFANPLGTIIAAGTTIQVIIPSLVNPPSTAVTASFSVKTFTYDGYAIDATTTGLNLAADTISASDFQTVTISASPATTGRTSIYTFDIVPTVAQLSTYTLSITFPSSMTFSSSVTCTVNLPTAASSTSCPASSSNVITVTLNQAVGALATFEIAVSGVINPTLSTTYTGFMLATYVGTAKVHQTSTARSITINPSVITTATLTRSNVVPSTAAVYTFDFVPINTYPSTAYIEVIVPTQLSVSTASTLACTNLLGMGSTPTCALKSGSTNTIEITGGGTYSTSEIRFGLDSIVNQASQVDSDSFIIYVKDTTTSYIIDQVTSGLQSLSQCGSACLTCSTTNRTACLSCDTGKLWDSVNLNCVTTCVTGTYQSGTSCLACNSKCYTCTGTATTCSSCLSTGSYPYLNGTTCVATCPDGYYSDSSNTCQQCVSPCNTCSSSSVCKTCIASNYLYNGACSGNCPDGYYKDDTTLTCTKCKSNCLTCSSLSVCTACDSTSSYTILYNNDCYSSCPDGSYTSGSTCVSCTSPCLTCSISATNCLSCTSGLYVNNGQCLSCSSNCATCSGAYDTCSSCTGSYLQGTKCVSTCSDGYYADTSLLQCVTCPTGCLTCTSKTKCTACNLSSSTPYMYQGSCVSSCPSGTSTSSGTTCTDNSGGSSGGGSSSGGTSTDEEIVNPYYGLYREGLPFPFLIFALIFCVLSCLGRVIKHQTVILGNILGFVSLIEFGAWIALAVLLPMSHPDESISYYPGFPLIIVALIASIVINIVFYFKVVKIIVKSDKFVKWKNGQNDELKDGLSDDPKGQKRRQKTRRAFAIISQICSLISLKSFRLIYSCFFNLDPMSAAKPDNTEYTDYLSTFYKYVGLNFFLGVLPAFIAAVITINKDSTFSQMRNISIEVMLLALFTVALTIIEALREHEEEKKKMNVAPDQTNLMIDDSVVNKLNTEERANQALSRKGKAGSVARRDSQGGVEGVEGSEYNEADTQGLNQSSSFINLNNSMTEKRLDAKNNDESFDGMEGAQVREENSKIEAIEEIEKDDEDDEPALNMNTKTMSKLQDMLRGKGTELAPQKILIENADGSIIVLKDPSPRKARKKANGDDDSEQELELQDSFEKDETKKGNDPAANVNNILDDKELKASNEGLLGKAEDSDIVNSGAPEMLSPIEGNPQTPVISEGFAPELEDAADGKGKKKGEDGFEYASSESQVSADDLHNHFMEDTPSNYNVLNQRYDEEFVTPAVMVPKKQVPALDSLKDSMNGSPPKPIVMQHNFMEKERTPPQVDYSRNLAREYPPPRSNSSAEKQTPQSMQNRTGYGKPMLGEKSKIMAEAGMRLVTPQKMSGQRRVPDSDKGPRNRSGTPTGSGSSYKASGSLDKKNGDVKGSRTGRLSDKDKPSTDRISELETMYVKKGTGNIGNIGNIGNVGNNGSVKSSLSKISKKQVNPQRSGDEELSDNDELELDNFGKFEEFVNGMRRPSVQKFDADSFDREIS